MFFPITFIGHKDHGKSTLIGRLLLDSGSIKEDKLREVKAIDKTLGKPFELAHILDSFQEEREEEMTIDTTFAYLLSKKRVYELIDVPGHSQLIQNMLTGASQARVAVLIISAKEGIEKQTLQHLSLASLLGTKELIVAVNKLDLVDWKRSAFEKIKRTISPFVKKNGFASVFYIPISANEGDNVVVHRSSKMPWYTGKSIYGYLESLVFRDNRTKLPLRIPIQDVYTVDGESIVVGKIESGSLKVGEKLIIFPQKLEILTERLLVRNILVDNANTGENVGLTLKNGHLEFRRGMVISGPKNTPIVSQKLRAIVVLIKKPQKEIILECGGQERRFSRTLFSQRPQGEKFLVDIELRSPLVVDITSDTILNKFVLKEKGVIIGAGVFLS